MSVHARRAKKERWAKAEEEAKATATEENPEPKAHINLDEVDTFFHI
jgi:hypothetical protein